MVIKHNLIPNLRMRKAMATPGRWYVHLANNLIGLYLTESSVTKLDDTVNWWAKGQTRNIRDFWRNSFYDRFPAAFLEAVTETQNELSTDKIVDFSQPPGK